MDSHQLHFITLHNRSVLFWNLAWFAHCKLPIAAFTYPGMAFTFWIFGEAMGVEGGIRFYRFSSLNKEENSHVKNILKNPPVSIMLQNKLPPTRNGLKQWLFTCLHSLSKQFGQLSIRSLDSVQPDVGWAHSCVCDQVVSGVGLALSGRLHFCVWQSVGLLAWYLSSPLSQQPNWASSTEVWFQDGDNRSFKASSSLASKVI